MPPKVSAQEKEWRAQDDAHTLAAAQEIQNDKTRLKAAQGAANKMLKEAENRANSLKKIAKPQRQAQTSSRRSTIKTKANTRIPGKKK